MVDNIGRLGLRGITDATNLIAALDVLLWSVVFILFALLSLSFYPAPGMPELFRLVLFSHVFRDMQEKSFTANPRVFNVLKRWAVFHGKKESGIL